MYDAASRSDLSALQRARGELHLVFESIDGTTSLRRLRQAGCLKARLPRPTEHGWADVVTLNTSGGIAGGDCLGGLFEIGAGARTVIATQAAERFYRALPDEPDAQVSTRIVVGEAAMAEWLPQETILFDRCAMQRRLDVELAWDSRFLAVEALVFGRTNMGERVRQARIRDLIRVRRAGRLLWQDAVRLDGAVDQLVARPAVANGARAVATIVHVAPDAADATEAARHALARYTAESGVSAWNGMLVARLLAVTAAELRAAVAGVLTVLRDGRPLPRVWLC